jgi:hypothetical protein
VTITRAVNSALFIVVILEFVRTIVARKEAASQLRPFLVIGIISATRDILTVGAELSLAERTDAAGPHDDRSGSQRRGGWSRYRSLWSWYAGLPGWSGPERSPPASRRRISVTLVPASHRRRTDRRSSSTSPPHTP